MLVLPKDWMERWQGRDAFDELFSLEGKIYSEQKGRKAVRFSIGGKYYFAKLHSGTGWKEIVKNLMQLRLPVFGAQNEWRAIKRLEQLNVKTMQLVGYGKRGWNPAQVQSFVITEELANTVSLEDFCRNWPTSPPDYALKRALIAKVAKIARALHEHGVNHRDFYICHLLLDVSGEREKLAPESLRIYLIDLHRVQIRRNVPSRWRVKDIAGLYFSSMDLGLTQRDLFCFIQVYRNRTLRMSLQEDRIFWQRVRRRGIRLYQKLSEKTAKVI